MNTQRTMDEVMKDMNAWAMAEGIALGGDPWSILPAKGSILDVSQTPEAESRIARLRARRLARGESAATEERMAELAAWVSDAFEESDGCSDDWAKLLAIASKLTGEERLYYVFLTTHFDSSSTAREFHSVLDWNRLLASPKPTLREIIRTFFQRSRDIGNHRRHFKCDKTDAKISFSLEILESYRTVMKKHGSQSQFFETNGRPDFEMLYDRMREIKHFHPRLPRFDHLERLARTHDFYIIPTRFFAADDKRGPRDGLTYLVLGKRLRRATGVTTYLVSEFPAKWNAATDPKYRICRTAGLGEVMTQLEIWTIDKVRKLLLPNQQNRPDYVFVLESCLCNWQKGK
jgi:hypothetical protein